MFSVLGGSITLFEGTNSYRPSEDSLWLASLLPDLPSPLICDVGCGTGLVGFAYAQRIKKAQIIGFDTDITMLKAAKLGASANDIPAYYAQANITTLPFANNSFDITIANPPFFSGSREMTTQDQAKKAVRFTTPSISLWLTRLIELTKQNGVIGVIFHSSDQDILLKTAQAMGCSVIGFYTLQSKPTTPPKRQILVLEKNNAPIPPPKPITIPTYDKELREQVLTKGNSVGLCQHLS